MLLNVDELSFIIPQDGVVGTLDAHQFALSLSKACSAVPLVLVRIWYWESENAEAGTLVRVNDALSRIGLEAVAALLASRPPVLVFSELRSAWLTLRTLRREAKLGAQAYYRGWVTPTADSMLLAAFERTHDGCKYTLPIRPTK
jgi:citrate lyase beta subunit